MYKYIREIKLEHKILSITFLLFFFALIYFHIKYNVGLFFDQPSMFNSIIRSLDSDFNGYLLLFDDRIRFFTNFLVSIPFNIEFNIYKLFVDRISLLTAVSIFTSSYYLIHIFALFANLLVSFRTKRYDIAIIAFAFYCIFCMPNLIWAVREIHISILFYFVLLSYFLSKQKLNRKDIFPITLLIIYMFESFEITIVYGFILNIFAFLYTVYKKDENLGFKNYIGVICFIASVYIISKMFMWIGGAIQGGFTEYFSAFTYYFNKIFESIILLSLFSIPVVVICCFYKKQFGIKSLISILIYFIAVAIFIVMKTRLIHDGVDEISFYSGAMIFIFPVILTILFIDYLEIKLDNKAFCANLFTVACIVGILQLCWQIHGCFEFNKYTLYLKNLIKTSDERLLEIPKNDFETLPYLRFYTPYGIIQQSILLNELPTVKTIIVPFKFKGDQKDWMLDRNTRIEDECNIIHTTYFFNKHKKYIDVSEISTYIEDQKRNYNLEHYYD